MRGTVRTVMLVAALVGGAAAAQAGSTNCNDLIGANFCDRYGAEQVWVQIVPRVDTNDGDDVVLCSCNFSTEECDITGESETLPACDLTGSIGTTPTASLQWRGTTEDPLTGGTCASNFKNSGGEYVCLRPKVSD